MQAIQQYGAMVKSPSGYPMQSPYVAIANRQAEILMRIAAEFGFTPASRSRIATPSLAERTLFDSVEEAPAESGPEEPRGRMLKSNGIESGSSGGREEKE